MIGPTIMEASASGCWGPVIGGRPFWRSPVLIPRDEWDDTSLLGEGVGVIEIWVLWYIAHRELDVEAGELVCLPRS
jgi:hypothetical protein